MMTWKFRSSYWRKLHKAGETKVLDRRNYAICWADYKDMATTVTWAVYGLPEFKVRGNSNLEVCKCLGETSYRKYVMLNYYTYFIIISFGALAFSKGQEMYQLSGRNYG
jgi:hypothetical protein